MSISITITNPSALSKGEVERLASYLRASVGAEPQLFTEEEVAEYGSVKTPGEAYRTPASVVSGFGTPDDAMADVLNRNDAASLFVTLDEAHLVIPSRAVGGTDPVASDLGLVVELDADGLPWDGRIHARTKVKNADETWRIKRGTDLTFLATVQAELKAAMAAPAAVPAPAPAAVPAPAPAAVPVSATEGVATFPQLLRFLTNGQATGAFTAQQIAAAHNGLGIPSLMGFHARPDLIPGMVKALS